MTLGEKIKSRRDNLGLSQEELATAACITGAMVSQIENNIKMPSSTVLFLIADRLNCKADDLRGSN